MSMFFLRYQEFYESINPEFRGKAFKYLDYMSWFVQYNNAHTFTYTKDFIGYNLPSSSIQECISLLPKNDKNKYDDLMIKLFNDLNKQNNKFYLIGTIRKDATFYHEIAHALYYLEPEYKKQIDLITSRLSPRFKHQIYNILATIYPEKVFDDEIQAYMSTRSWMTGMDRIKGFETIAKKYENNFQNWLVRLELKNKIKLA